MPDPAPTVRPGKAERRRKDELVFIGGGDVGLGRALGRKIRTEPDYDPFSKVRDLLASADLRFVNLESPLSDQPGGSTVSRSNYLVFTGPPAGARTISQAGIEVVSLANNHVWDYGKAGLFETIEHLDAAGIAHAGASRRPSDRYAPAVIRVLGWSVAVFAVTHIWNQPPFDAHPGRYHVAWASLPALQKRLKRARTEYDVVLLSYHGRGEYIEQPLPEVRRFFHHVMRTGVDAVIGHHAHVPRGVQFDEGRPAFYSVGNLVFEPWTTSWARIGYFVRLTFRRTTRGQPSIVEVCPYRIDGRELPVPEPFRARSDRDRLLEEFRERFRRLSSDLDTPVGLGEPDALGCMIVAP